MRVSIGFIACALIMVAMSVGAVVPTMRLFVVDRLAQHELAASAFVICHVLGTMVGVRSWSRCPGISGPGAIHVRALGVASMLLSATLLVMMAFTTNLSQLLALRLLDGVAHVGAVMSLMGAGASGDAEERKRRMSVLGTCLVIGVGLGIAVGGYSARFGMTAPFFVAAALTFAATWIAIVALPSSLEQSVAANDDDAELPMEAWFAAALALGERFAVGVISVGLPLAVATSASGAAHVGRILSVFVAASVLGMPLGRVAAKSFGTTRAARSTGLLTCAAMLPLAWLGLLTSSLGFAWAVTAGGLAGMLFMCCLLLTAESPRPTSRMRAAGFVHALGGMGYALGALTAGVAAAATRSAGPALSALALSACACGALAVSSSVGFLHVRDRHARLLVAPVRRSTSIRP